jgi:hypothetical protein
MENIIILHVRKKVKWQAQKKVLWTSEKNDVKINIHAVYSDVAASPEHQKLEQKYVTV